MSLSFCYWAPAPNRHLDPFLEEGFRVGALDHVVYGKHSLPPGLQLGTKPPRRDEARETILEGDADWRRKALERIRGGYDFHVIYEVGHPLPHFVMNACARHRVPYLFFAESLQLRSRASPRRLAREVLYRFLLRAAAGVLVVGVKGAADFERMGFRRSRLFPAMYPGPTPRHPRRAPADGHQLVYCGRLLELKGLDTLAEAILQLRGRGLELSLSIVGDGLATAPLERLTAAGVRVERHGVVPSERVAQLISGASALVLPTKTREGWGYVVNEALMAGVPVVVSDVVGSREVVVAGRNGAVFTAGDPGSLARALEDAVALQRDEGRLEDALAVTQAALEPQVYVRYVLEVARAALGREGAAPWPPWLLAAEELGGNPETRWWRTWRKWRQVEQASEVNA